MLIGGKFAGVVGNSVFVFNLIARTWKRIENYKGKPPGHVSGASSCVDRHFLYIYGGNGDRRHADLHLLSTSSGYTWSRLCRFSLGGSSPSNLLVSFGSRLILFGGISSVEQSLGLFNKSTQELVPLSAGSGEFQVSGSAIHKGNRVAITAANHILIVNKFNADSKEFSAVKLSPDV